MNQIPQPYDPLIQLLEDAADGAHQHGAAIGLKQNTEVLIRIDLEALIGKTAGPGNVPPAVPGLKASWNTAKANKSAMTAVLRTAQSNGRSLAMACTGSLKPLFGQQWGSAWNAAGFTDGSLSVPVNPMIKLQQLRAYYGTNPTSEVPTLNGIACTAVACEAAAQAIGTARSDSNESNTIAGKAQSAFQDGVTVARARASGLLAELGQQLEDNAGWRLVLKCPAVRARPKFRRMSRLRPEQRARMRCSFIGMTHAARTVIARRLRTLPVARNSPRC